MNRDRVLSWPQMGYYASALLIGVSALLFWLAVLEWHPPRRLFVYPILLVCVIYLWDTTLPPPNLPEGPLRELIPRIIVLWLFADGVLTIQRSRKTRWRAIQTRGRTLTLEDAALLLATTPDDLRQQLGQVGRTPRTSDDGQEWLSFDDLKALTE